MKIKKERKLWNCQTQGGGMNLHIIGCPHLEWSKEELLFAAEARNKDFQSNWIFRWFAHDVYGYMFKLKNED